MSLQISNAEAWIAQKAPAQALDYLSNAVDALNKTAVEKNIVFKEKKVKDQVLEKETEDVNAVDNAVENTAEVETEEVVEIEEVVTKEDSEEGNADANDILAVIQKGISDAVLVALKEYNDTVVAPLQAQLAELASAKNDTVEKSYSGLQNVFFGASDFMPAAAVSAMIKKEFGVQNEQAGDIEVTPEKVEKAKTVVKEKAEVVNKSAAGDPNNLLAGF